MEVVRYAAQGLRKLGFFTERLVEEPLLVLYYLDDEEKLPLRAAETYRAIDFDRAVVARTTMRGRVKINAFRRFLDSFISLPVDPGLSKLVKIIYLELADGNKTDFWIIFVNRVFINQKDSDQIRRSDISYFEPYGNEIKAWEQAAADWLRHYTGGVTVIK